MPLTYRFMMFYAVASPAHFGFLHFFLRNLSYGRQKEAKPLACLGRVWHCMDWKGSTQEVHESVFNSTHLSGLLQKRGHTCVRTLQDCLDWICCASSTPSPFNASQENICHGLSSRQCVLRLWLQRLQKQMLDVAAVAQLLKFRRQCLVLVAWYVVCFCLYV